MCSLTNGAKTSTPFEIFFRALPDIAIITRLQDGTYVDVSDRFCEATGYAREDLIGRRSSEVGVWMSPEDRDFMIAALREKGRFDNLELEFNTANGTPCCVALAGGIVQIDGERYLVTVSRDITERKREAEERRRMEVQARRAQQLESLGVLAGGIAHDFNNLLTVIAGNLGVASRLVHDDPGAAGAHIAEAENAVLRASDLTRQLLTFSCGGKPQRSIIELGAVLRESVGFALSGSRHSSQVLLDPDLSPVEADAGQVAQVLHNLVLNADQAMQTPGVITVSAANTFDPVAKLGFVKVSVKDSGPGVPSEIAERVFDPFFSTKPKGSGLGLATAHSIVRAHGGRLEIEATGPNGTTFSFLLPAAAGVPAPKARASEQPTRPLRILVLDDEASLCDVLVGALELSGHQVTAVREGRQAIAALERELARGSRFDVALLDLTVPGGMGGKEALIGLKALDPSIAAVATSGYSCDPVMSDYEAHGFVARLPKPYRIAELGPIITTALRAANAKRERSL